MNYLDELMQEAEDSFREAGIDIVEEEERRNEKMERPLARVSLVSGPHGKDTRVIVNGVDMSRYLDGLTFEAPVNGTTRVTLTFPAVVMDGYLETTVFSASSRKYVLDDRPWWKRLLKRR